MDALLPCPFCGGEAKIDGTSWTTRDGKDQAWATCKKCGTYGPSSADAIAAWNRRSPTALAAACLALVARARTDEAMTDQEGRLADALSVIEDKLRDVKGERG